MKTKKSKDEIALSPDSDGFIEQMIAQSKRMRSGLDVLDEKVRFVKTRFPGLNRVMASGTDQPSAGVPLGTTGIVHGLEHSGKTSFLAGLAASFQDAGGQCLYVDVEGTLVKSWAWRLGVNPKRFAYLGRYHVEDRPEAGKVIPTLFYEDVIQEVDNYIEKYTTASQLGKPMGPLLIVIDSLPKLVPKDVAKRIDNSAGQLKKGMLGRAQAEYNTSWCAELGPKIVDYNICILFVQHQGEGEPDFLGRPTTKIKGGRYLRTDASMIAETKFAKRVYDLSTEKEVACAKAHRVIIGKNKIGSQQFGTGSSFEFFVSTGIGLCPLGYDRPRELVNEAARRGLIDVEWSYKLDLHLSTGISLNGNTVRLKALYEKPELVAQLEEMLM